MTSPITPVPAVEGKSAVGTGTTPRSWVIEMPPGTALISANNRLNRYARNTVTQEIKQKIAAVARWMPRQIGRADITVEYASPPRLRRDRHPFASDVITDADNVAPTAKALVDGLVLAGILRTDTKRCVRQVTYKLADETHPRGLLRVTIAEVTGNE